MPIELIEKITIQLFSSLATLIELCAAFIIVSACLLAEQSLRIELGFALSLALEFELGADILKTAIAPNWQAIGIVASIIVLRTMLNYFLQIELEHEERRKQKAKDTQGETV